MNLRTLLLAAAALCVLGTTGAVAQRFPDPDGYYSDTDQRGYYDRSGTYHRFERDADRGYPDDGRNRPVPYYREGRYERDCRSGNAAGTIFGAAGGGLIAGAASHGNAGAVVGGVLLGGLLGNTLTRDIDCDDQRYAFETYSGGLNGEVGRRYDWRHGSSNGYFTPTREYYDGGQRCREFTTITYRGGREIANNGVACYENDGYWHFR